MNNSYIYLFSPELGICSFAHSPSALSLKITQFKEWLWAIHSLCSLQKNDFEWFAHVALYKSVTWTNCSSCSLKKNNVSDSLVIRMNRLQKKSESLKKFVFLSFWHKKWANCSKNPWATSQPWFSKVSAQTKYSTVVIAINTSEWCWTVEYPPVVKLCCWNMWSKLKGLACMCQLHNIGKKVL